MQFELISGNLIEFERLCNKILFNPVIKSAGFEDDFKVTVNLDRYNLADFSMLIRNLNLEVIELPA